MRLDFVKTDGERVASFTVDDGEPIPSEGALIKAYGRYRDDKRIRYYQVVRRQTNVLLMGAWTWKRSSMTFLVNELNPDNALKGENEFEEIIMSGNEPTPSFFDSVMSVLENIPGFKDNKTYISGALLILLVVANMLGWELPAMVTDNYNELALGLLAAMGMSMRRAMNKNEKKVEDAVAAALDQEK